jgi:ribonuclease D
VRGGAGDGPPPPRAWADRAPEAAARLAAARAGLDALSTETRVPVENLLTPDSLRRVLWEPPGATLAEVEAALGALGARRWQVALTAPVLTAAITGERTSALGAEDPGARRAPASESVAEPTAGALPSPATDE